jgi:hypothetical protein
LQRRRLGNDTAVHLPGTYLAFITVEYKMDDKANPHRILQKE